MPDVEVEIDGRLVAWLFRNEIAGCGIVRETRYLVSGRVCTCAFHSLSGGFHVSGKKLIVGHQCIPMRYLHVIKVHWVGRVRVPHLPCLLPFRSWLLET